MKTDYFLVLAGIAFSSCSPSAESGPGEAKDEYDNLWSLYHEADTIFERNDTVFVVNTKLDTVVVQTGIFTYLGSAYPLYTPDELVIPVKQALQAENNGDTIRSRRYYQAAVDYYQTVWLNRKEGFENGEFSCLNDYYAFNVRVAILASYAFEKLNRRPEALRSLARFLANSESEATKIEVRFIELCVKQYGKAATRRALETCGSTIHRLPEQSPESDLWRVRVFEGNLGVAHFNNDSLSPQQAQAIIRESRLYSLVE